MPQSPEPARPGSAFIVIFFTCFLSGFVALQLLRPQGLQRTLETDQGPWFDGLTVGMIYALAMLVLPLILALTQSSRRP